MILVLGLKSITQSDVKYLQIFYQDYSVILRLQEVAANRKCWPI